MCPLGDSCSRLHFVEATEGRTAGHGTTRRPLLQLVVLFAGDARVYHYCSRIAQRFLDAGVDVYLQVRRARVGTTRASFLPPVPTPARDAHRRPRPPPPPPPPMPCLQTDLVESGLGDPAAPSPQYIKPADLSAVIAASHGDFLIVVGDKNMKNETCQARRAGKLVEMAVDERIVTLLESWAAQTGLRAQAPSPQGGAADASDKAIGGMTEEALLERIKRLTGASNLSERAARVTTMVAELLEESRGHRRAGGAGGRRAGGTMLPAGGSGGLLSDSDQNAVARLTKLQTALVRLHKELADALGCVQRLPVLPVSGRAAAAAAAAAGGGAGGAQLTAPGAPAHLDLGLGVGTQVPCSYRPNGAGPVAGAAGGAAASHHATISPPSASSAAAASSSSAASSSGHAAASPAALPSALRARMTELLAGLKGRCELEGAAASDAAGPGAMALWNAYLAVSGMCSFFRCGDLCYSCCVVLLIPRAFPHCGPT